MALSQAGLLCLFIGSVSLADQNWDGDNAVGNFSFNNNWFGDNQPGWGFGGSLHFSFRNNTSQTSLFNDYGNWVDTGNIFWDSSFNTGLTLGSSGNGINFNQRIENNSSSTQVLNCPTSGNKNGAGHIELNPVNGDLILLANVFNDNNSQYQVWGNNSKMLTVGVNLTGNSGVSMIIEQNSKVKFTNAQTWGSASSITVNQGELWIDNGGSLATGLAVNLGLADANTAKFWFATAASGLTVGQNITVANTSGAKVIGTLNATANNTFSGNITLNGPVQLIADKSGGSVTFSGIISGANNVTNAAGSSGTGTVILSGNNSYSGSTIVSAGALNIRHANALGTSTAGTTVSSGAELQLQGGITAAAEPLTLNGTGISSAGALHNINGNNTFAGAITLGSASRINSDSGTLTLNSATAIAGSGLALTVGGGGDTSISSGIGTGTSGTLTKDGSGTLTLSGASTFTGNTTISAGKVSVLNLSALGTAGTITANSTLEFGAGLLGTFVTSLTLNNGSTLSSAAGGAMTYTKSLSPNIASGASVTVSVPSASDVLTFGSLFQNGSSGLVTITGSGVAVMNSSGGTGAGVYSGNWQVNSPATLRLQNSPDNLGNNTGTRTVTLAGGTLDNRLTASPTTMNYNLAVTADAAINAGRSSSGSGVAHNYGTLSLSGNTLTLNQGANVSGGTMSVSFGATTLSGNAMINVNPGANGPTLSLGAVGETGGSRSLTKSGTGTLTLSAAGTYTGKTIVGAGTLQISTDANLGTAPGSTVDDQLTLDGGTLRATATMSMDSKRGITVTANNGGLNSSGTGSPLTLNNSIKGVGGLTVTSGSLSLFGNNTFAGDLTIAATAGNNVRIAFNSNTAAGNGKVNVTPAASGTVTLRNFDGVTSSTLANDVVFDPASSATISLDANDSTSSFSLSGNFTGTAAVTSGGNANGGGTITLSGNNSGWSGGLTCARGTLRLGHKSALGTGALAITPATTSPQTVGLQATVPLSGANAVANSVTINTAGTAPHLTFVGANDLELSGPITLVAASPTLANNNSGATVLSGVIAGSGFGMTLSGTGTLTLSGNNIYDGPTAIASGTVTISSLQNVGSGTANSLGKPTTVANGTIAIGSTATAGTLRYTGSGHTSDRVINLAGTTGGATLDASGSGALTFTSGFTATGSGAKTLTLAGSSTAANVIVSVANSGGGNTALTKSGSGKWVITGTSTHSGATTIPDRLSSTKGRSRSRITTPLAA